MSTPPLSSHATWSLHDTLVSEKIMQAWPKSLIDLVKKNLPQVRYMEAENATYTLKDQDLHQLREDTIANWPNDLWKASQTYLQYISKVEETNKMSIKNLSAKERLYLARFEESFHIAETYPILESLLQNTREQLRRTLQGIIREILDEKDPLLEESADQAANIVEGHEGKESD